MPMVLFPLPFTLTDLGRALDKGDVLSRVSVAPPTVVHGDSEAAVRKSL